MTDLRAPYPYFGGKATIMPEVWKRFGDVRNFVDPFMGSLAPLLCRPQPFEGTETVNDADGFISNFWRAIKADPEAVAEHADWPVNECDLHARHAWLVGKRDDITAKLEGDPDWFDAKAAGWWCWGACCWIGSGWCSGNGPWQSVEMPDGSRQLVHLGSGGQGVNRQLVHLGSGGQGVNRQLVHLGSGGRGVNRKLVHLGSGGRGVNRKRVALCPGMATMRKNQDILAYFAGLSDRLRNVRVCCGDWTRVCGPTPTVKQGLTAVFLDPPYADEAKRTADLYSKDSGSVAHAVREWALEHGDDPMIRVALCGYDGEHQMPETWECLEWKTRGGYGSQSQQHDNPNARRERIWFSPSCLRPRKFKQATIFDLNGVAP